MGIGRGKLYYGYNDIMVTLQVIKYANTIAFHSINLTHMRTIPLKLVLGLHCMWQTKLNEIRNRNGLFDN